MSSIVKEVAVLKKALKIRRGKMWGEEKDHRDRTRIIPSSEMRKRGDISNLKPNILIEDSGARITWLISSPFPVIPAFGVTLAPGLRVSDSGTQVILVCDSSAQLISVSDSGAQVRDSGTQVILVGDSSIRLILVILVGDSGAQLILVSDSGTQVILVGDSGAQLILVSDSGTQVRDSGAQVSDSGTQVILVGDSGAQLILVSESGTQETLDPTIFTAIWFMVLDPSASVPDSGAQVLLVAESVSSFFLTARILLKKSQLNLGIHPILLYRRNHIEEAQAGKLAQSSAVSSMQKTKTNSTKPTQLSATRASHNYPQLGIASHTSIPKAKKTSKFIFPPRRLSGLGSRTLLYNLFLAKKQKWDPAFFTGRIM
ncbi:hypothetical protein B0H13DRAFT_2262467 [Mycena leptocephala]|nr:hypothetical protein B0H13DRAFT_2262467 [Mycena leptocephala]